MPQSSAFFANKWVTSNERDPGEVIINLMKISILTGSGFGLVKAEAYNSVGTKDLKR